MHVDSISMCSNILYTSNMDVGSVGGICLSARICPCFHDSVNRVRPAELVSWSNTFSYFRFLFITRQIYGVKRQGNLLTEILLLHQYVSTSVHQYASMSVRQYAIMRYGCSTSVRQYISTPVRQYVSTSVRQYVSTSVCHVI
jgi:hypothetical protein